MTRAAEKITKKMKAENFVRRCFLSIVFLICCAAFGYVSSMSTKAQQTDFSTFKHSNPTHTRLPCLVCHTRNDNSTTMKYPGHIPCASCHTQQFADNTNPICMICHTTTSVKNFPGLKTFTASFDHAKHLPLTNCASCHKINRRGAGFSIPSGAGAHTSCFQCHSANASNEMASCDTCHQPGSPPRTSDWAKAYATTFMHSRHLQTMNCESCHTVRTEMGRGRQVTAPLTSMHFAPRGASCAACHNNRRAFGGDDFDDCKRCHRGTSFKF
jgi:c(7)-type cytochrome triheme protein